MPNKLPAKLNTLQKTLLIIGIILLVTIILVLIQSINTGTPRVLPISDNVQVSGQLYACKLELTTRPESRIPASNNWDTTLKIGFYDTNNTLVDTITAPSDNFGKTTLDLCAAGYKYVGADYTLLIKGYSHLTRKFTNVRPFDYLENSLLFTNPNQYLLAGDTSVVEDDAVNALDVSTQTRQDIIYTNNNKNDLNQDGVVNALDYSITMRNYYKLGESL